MACVSVGVPDVVTAPVLAPLAWPVAWPVVEPVAAPLVPEAPLPVVVGAPVEELELDGVVVLTVVGDVPGLVEVVVAGGGAPGVGGRVEVPSPVTSAPFFGVSITKLDESGA